MSHWNDVVKFILSSNEVERDQADIKAAEQINKDMYDWLKNNYRLSRKKQPSNPFAEIFGKKK
jgi:hypothetical protein